MPPTKYKMPKPTAIVMWRPSPGIPPSPAAVTHVGQTAVNLMIFPPDSRAGLPKDAVRHSTDPLVKNQLAPEAGIWDFTPEYLDLLGRIEKLESIRTDDGK
jgi:hypothetical protein